MSVDEWKGNLVWNEEGGGCTGLNFSNILVWRPQDTVVPMASMLDASNVNLDGRPAAQPCLYKRADPLDSTHPFAILPLSWLLARTPIIPLIIPSAGPATQILEHLTYVQDHLYISLAATSIPVAYLLLPGRFCRPSSIACCRSRSYHCCHAPAFRLPISCTGLADILLSILPCQMVRTTVANRT